MKPRVKPSGRSGYAMLARICVVLGVLASTARAEDYAILVGIADYHRYRKELEPLKYSRNDIIEFASELQKSGYKKANIILMHEDQKDPRLLPETKKINDQINQIIDEFLQPGDTLLVALAGHGVQFLEEATNYFCPIDAIPSPDKRDTLISIDDLTKRLANSRASHKLLLVDACRNDPLSKLSRSADGVRLASVTRPPIDEVPAGLAALFSCSAQQKSYEDDGLRHGIFFYNVLQAWRGEADGFSDPPASADGKLTFSELARFVKDRTQAYAQIHFRKPQIPVWPDRVQDWVVRRLDAGASAFYANAEKLYAQGKYGQARMEYSRAIEQNERLVPAYIGRGLSRLMLSDRPGAIADFTKALQKDPSHAALAYRLRAIAYGQSGEFESAIEDYTSSIELDRNSPAAYVGRGGAYYKTRKFAEALSDLNRAIDLNSELASAYRNRSYVYEQLGQPARAKNDLARAQQLERAQAGATRKP